MTSTLLNGFQLLTNVKTKRSDSVDSRVFGRRLGLITRIIGCQHKSISRPFVEGKTGYRSCLSCGARKQFNPDTLETYPGFYCPPVIKA